MIWIHSSTSCLIPRTNLEPLWNLYQPTQPGAIHPNTLSEVEGTKRVFSWYSWLSSMPHANHGTRATVNDSCVSKAQIVAQVKATDQCPATKGEL